MEPPRDISMRQRLAWCVGFLGIFWAVELFVHFAGLDLHAWGILPRTRVGLRGILFAPLLHLDLRHLALNTGPLAVFVWLTLGDGRRAFLRVTLTIQLLGGLAVWVLARSSYHVGASGLVLGYFGYLVACAALRRNWRSFAVAALVVLFYGGLVTEVLPGRGAVSWEMHLAGLLAGTLAAWAWPADHSGRDVGQ